MSKIYGFERTVISYDGCSGVERRISLMYDFYTSEKEAYEHMPKDSYSTGFNEVYNVIELEVK